jgi:hypothetical protein
LHGLQWASIATRVQWYAVVMYNFPLRALACTRLLEERVAPLGSPFLGELACGALVFRGPLLPVRRAALDAFVFMRFTSGSVDGAAASSSSSSSSSALEIDATMGVHEFAPDCVENPGGEQQQQQQQQLYMLPLMVRLGGTYQTDALVLRRRAEPDTYERVGRVTLNYIRGGSPSAPPVTGSRYVLYGYSETPEWVEAYLSSLVTHQVIIV